MWIKKVDVLIKGYELLDSEKESKLERVGDYILARPSPQAVWSPSIPETK